MKSERINNTVLNARWALLFNALLLVVNMVSRQVFIEDLGNSFLGLAASVTSIIGFLSLAELGVVSALTQALYKPIVERDERGIQQTVSVIAFLFRWIGIIIGGLGLVIAVVLPFMFDQSEVSLTQVYVTFFTLLVVTMLSYLVNYKQVLMLAAQKNFVVTKIQNTTLIAKFVAQIILLYYFNLGWISWLVCELLTAVGYAGWLEWQINRHFPWLKSSYCEGRAVFPAQKGLIRNARNIFGQNIAGRVLLSSDNIVVLNILNAAQVTYFVNYTMLMQRISSILVGALSASASGVGQLVASGDNVKIRLVFNQINALYYWLGGIVAFGFYNCVNPLLEVWLADVEKEIYPSAVVLLLSANLFINIVSRPSEYFLAGYALFHDVWAAWVQMFLNLGLSIWLTIEYGIIGVVVGTTISTALHTLVWKPYFLCSQGFRTTPLYYWSMILKYLLLITASWLGVDHFISLGLLPTPNTSWLNLILFGAGTTLLYTILSTSLFLLSDKGAKSLSHLAKGFILKR